MTTLTRHLTKPADVVYGQGIVPLVYTDDPSMRGRLGWALPGGFVTIDRDFALEWAKRIDEIMRVKWHPAPNGGESK